MGTPRSIGGIEETHWYEISGTNIPKSDNQNEIIVKENDENYEQIRIIN